MKKTLVILVVLMLAFAVVIPAAAGNGPGGGGKGGGTGTGSGTGTETGTGTRQQNPRGTFAITGTITSIGTNTVTVDVVRGNKLVQSYIGTKVTMTVTIKTIYNYRDGTTITRVTSADLKVGQPVSIGGTVANNIWTASRITVGASLSCLP